MKLITKEQFLIEHNKLSPPNLQATPIMITQFQEDKRPLLKDDGWCLERLRMSFILWILNSPSREIKRIKKGK